MKAFTFLGTSTYKPAHYIYGSTVVETDLFAIALPQFFPEIDQLLLFATPEVIKDDKGNLKNLKEHFGNRLKVVRIPNGRSTEDLWEIFSALTSSIDEDEEVVIDITNSFRSIPFLVFLATAYLRAARKVHVKAVIYGAYDATDDAGNAPVFDLTPFVSLLDWLTATEQFIQTGDARPLAKLLNPKDDKSGSLAQASKALTDISLAAFLCQPFRLMQEAPKLDDILQSAENSVPNLPKPFDLLRDQIVKTFGKFEGDLLTEPDRTLSNQLKLIDWYHNNNQLMQAVTLAREWIISIVTIRLGKKINLQLDDRQNMERAVNGITFMQRSGGDYQPEQLTQLIIETIPEYDTLGRLWTKLSSVRNLLDHAGHQKDMMKMEKAIRKFDEVLPELNSFACKWLNISETYPTCNA